MSLFGISVHDVWKEQIDGQPQENYIFYVSGLKERGNAKILITKRQPWSTGRKCPRLGKKSLWAHEA